MLLGVDAGGTSTRAVLLDRQGRCLGYGAAGGGNPVSWGPDLAAAAIGRAVAAAIAQGRGSGALSPATGQLRLGSAVLAMAGGGGWRSTAPIDAELRALGLDGAVTVESDLLATFCSGTAAQQGYALISGTGAAAIRVRAGTVENAADGLGWLLGDEGSGFWLGHQVVRSALAALDGRGPKTALTGLLLEALDIPGEQRPLNSGRPEELRDAVDALYRIRPVGLSRFAALAFRAAGLADALGAVQVAGDAAVLAESAPRGERHERAQRTVDSPAGQPDTVATGILREAVRRLLQTLAAVRVPGLAGPVVLGGGVARRLPGLAGAIVAQPSTSGDGTSAGDVVPKIIMVDDGVAGAAVLALRHAGITVDERAFKRVITSLAPLR